MAGSLGAHVDTSGVAPWGAPDSDPELRGSTPLSAHDRSVATGGLLPPLLPRSRATRRVPESHTFRPLVPDGALPSGTVTLSRTFGLPTFAGPVGRSWPLLPDLLRRQGAAGVSLIAGTEAQFRDPP